MNTETQNYKIIVAYDGTRYKGWQVQKSTDDTIQGKLQHVLNTLAGNPVEVICLCDAGELLLYLLYILPGRAYAYIVAGP